MPDTLMSIGEFGLIDRIHKFLQREGAQAPGVMLGIGDNTGSFRPRAGYEVLVTCDCLVEGRHFLPDYITPLDLGRRAMVANISDIGAMGGYPLYALVSLGLRKETLVADVEAMYRGFILELNPFQASIIGGNITGTEGANFIDITLIGEIKRSHAILRSTARVGDAILVTGYPGQAAAGLKLLLRSQPSEDLTKNPLVRAHMTPSHRAWEGQAIARSRHATAMIDTSDGLLGDLGHICKESGVGALLIQEKLPLSEDLKKGAIQLGLDPHELVLHDSDDYELILTCASDKVVEIRSTVAKVSHVPVTEIGRVTDKVGDIQVVLPDGSKRSFSPKGWDHFAI